MFEYIIIFLNIKQSPKFLFYENRTFSYLGKGFGSHEDFL